VESGGSRSLGYSWDSVGAPVEMPGGASGPRQVETEAPGASLIVTMPTDGEGGAEAVGQ
jgi:hypothetical protein